VNRPGFRDERTQNARRIFAVGAGTSTSAERRFGAVSLAPLRLTKGASREHSSQTIRIGLR
jgi:hypothetical protein